MTQFEKIIERPRAFNSFEDAMAHLAKMERAARERPDLVHEFNSQGDEIAKAESDRIAKLRAKPPAVRDFELLVEGIAEREGVPKLRAMEIARRRHPAEFKLFEEA